jgi:hypothetical protein
VAPVEIEFLRDAGIERKLERVGSENPFAKALRG